MKTRQFYDEEHANRYLSSSVIRIGQTPIFVHNVFRDEEDKEIKINCSPIKYLQRKKIILLSDPRIDMNPIPNGFINMSEWGGATRCIYIARVPTRSWKIGLYEGNMQGTYSNGVFINDREKRRIILSGSLHAMVGNSYPSLPEAIKQVMELGANSYAFSRKFAITRNGRLHYYQLPESVGKIYDDKQVALDDEYIYLSELLGQELTR